MSKPHEDPALLRELFTYDPATGRVFHAKDKRSGRGAIRVVAHAGDYADRYTNANGYRYASVTSDGKQRRIQTHRVAWILAHGAIPDGLQVDHVNGVRDDNRLCNLRLVTQRENQHNLRSARGYCWDSHRGKWKAQIQVDGRNINLGCHDTELDARTAYLAAKRIYHPSAPINYQ
ncbi:HNH endonuclease signature motif containing protein [Cronobacter malonaticus]|uniref:HNH endonuclease signature motif containing protein n=1 Tax=Enterobacteriaceae TaxID=543 RepID=UPI001EF87E51|nr:MULTISPECIES: HNH endonuclease signature motif containing protein [Enterobacteriaceae]